MSLVSTTKSIEKAAGFIAGGRVVAVPTGTFYALAADALQGHAIQRVRHLKKRPSNKPFSVMLDPALLGKYFRPSRFEKKIIEQYAGTALTILLKPKKNLQHLAQNSRVALRLIDHPLMQQLVACAAVPLTATSANVANQEPCASPSCITDAFPGKDSALTYNLSLAAILDGGQLSPSEPSTIIEASKKRISIVRPGQVSASDLGVP